MYYLHYMLTMLNVDLCNKEQLINIKIFFIRKISNNYQNIWSDNTILLYPKNYVLYLKCVNILSQEEQLIVMFYSINVFKFILTFHI